MCFSRVRLPAQAAGTTSDMQADKKADDTETDVQSDEAVAGSRAPEGEYVGRVTGDTSGAAGESGAEVREKMAKPDDEQAKP